MDARMVQEAAILDGLHHPGVVRVFDCGLLGDGRPWIAMELVTGDSLANRLARESQLAPAAVCTLLASIADVLATVHACGITHRDLKPDNVLFADVAEFPLRIIDWGVARLGRLPRLTLPGITCGTPTYMSPEQATGTNIGAPCDIYSLGVIAYETLAGQPPFDGANLVEVVSAHLHGEAAPLSERCPTAPPALCALIHEMLRKVPSSRPTAAAVRERICTIAATLADVNAEFESYDVTTQSPSAVDYAALATELFRRPRWTPEVPPVVAALWGDAVLRPHGARWEVAGEFVRTH
jgi:serine/threonine protein kinase